MLKCVAKFDLVLDYSFSDPGHDCIRTELSRLINEQRIFDVAGRVTIIIPEKFSLPPEFRSDYLAVFDDARLAMASALREAEWDAHALAIIKGLLGWNPLTISALIEHANADPMVGAIQGRFISHSADKFYSLPGQPSFTIPYAAANYLPEYYLTTEFDSNLIVLTSQGVRNAPRVEALPQPFDYTHVYRALRRRGLRNLVCNRIMIPTELSPGLTYPPKPSFDDSDNAARDDPQLWLAEMPEQRLETILAGAFTPAGKPRLLIDCRGMPPYFNGTTVCILGFLQGFKALAENPFAIVVLASDEAAHFHDLAGSFPDFEIITDCLQDTYFGAILMNQPWTVDTLRQYNDISWLNLYNMLDTIAWDIGFAASAELHRVWSLLGQAADAILFNSSFSRDRYVFRFRPDDRVPLVVTHHSTVPSEIVGAPCTAVTKGAERFLFVVGNDYDHKSMEQTLDTLAEAFPYTRIVALGVNSSRHANVEAMASGNLAREQVAELYATAEAVVFPSHYEGFGLPVVEALAWGKPVLVRSSPLWDEVSALSSRAGLIVRFSFEGELIEKVARLLESPPPESTPSAGAESSWSECAGRIVDTVARLALAADRNAWAKRRTLLAR